MCLLFRGLHKLASENCAGESASYKKHQCPLAIEGMTMKRSLIIVLIAILVVAVFSGVFFFRTIASAKITGEISSDTTWTTFSVYSLTGNVTVNKGVQLTIQPAVAVELNGFTLQVDGTLYARGNWIEKIDFNGGQITFTNSSSAWNEQASSGCIMENCVSSALIAIHGSSPKLTHSDFEDPNATKNNPD